MTTLCFEKLLLKVNNIIKIDIPVASRRLHRILHTVWHSSTTSWFGLLTECFVAQDEEDEPAPAMPAGNQEHIIGTGGESETLDPRTFTV